jgi:RimJ/RimL family protein N-acetyltransferase
MPVAIPDPPLSAGAITLRPWSMDDVPDLVRCCNDPDVRRWLPPIAIPYTHDDGVAFVESVPEFLTNDALRLAIADRDTGALRGSIGLRLLSAGVAQTGYWVDPEARGRGIAPTAVTVLSRWALRTLGLIRVQLFTDVDNPASQRVAERAGFAREGILRNWYDLRGERRDAVMFSLLPTDLA